MPLRQLGPLGPGAGDQLAVFAAGIAARMPVLPAGGPFAGPLIDRWLLLV
jgi:hypothetical protein